MELHLLSHFLLDPSEGFAPHAMQISRNSHRWKRVNQQAGRSMFMQECGLAIPVYRGVKSEPKWVTTILLITHENGESGCCEDRLFRGPCYFNRDLQWNVFIRAEAAAQARLLLRRTMAALITEGLRGQRPKPTPADSLQPLCSNFCFPLLQTAGMSEKQKGYTRLGLPRCWKEMTPGTRI